MKPWKTGCRKKRCLDIENIEIQTTTMQNAQCMKRTLCLFLIPFPRKAENLNVQLLTAGQYENKELDKVAPKCLVGNETAQPMRTKNGKYIWDVI